MLERPQQSTQYQRRTQAVRPTGLTPAMSPEAAQRIAPNTSPVANSTAAVGSAGRPSPNPTAATRSGLTPSMPPPAQPRGMSTSDYTAALRAGGPINVNAYKGSMWSQQPVAAAAPQRAAAAPATQPVKPPQQTEAANPMVGTQATAPTGATTAVTPPASPAAAGLSSRGGAVPQGQDALPADPNMGGSGVYARRFSSPASAKIYDTYVRSLFGDAQAGAQ